jgi:hypothetical protein
MTARATFDSETLKVQAEATHILLELDGVQVRVWNAITEGGDQVFLFVHRVASRADLQELIETPQPATMRATR